MENSRTHTFVTGIQISQRSNKIKAWELNLCKKERYNYKPKCT